MKIQALFALSLTLLAGGAAAGPRPAWLRGPVHEDWHQALQASRVDPRQPVVLQPLRYSEGVALYRVRGTVDGTTDRVLVRVPGDPTVRPAAEPREGIGNATAAICAPDSPRCDLPYGNWSSDDSSRCAAYIYSNANYNDLLIATPIDLNTLDFSITTNLNDKTSSLKTTCAPAYFFEHKNWGGSVLYVPANTQLPNLQNQGFNDKITSLFHALP